MWRHPGRIVELVCDSRGGSGYFVGPHLILTAFHVIQQKLPDQMPEPPMVNELDASWIASAGVATTCRIRSLEQQDRPFLNAGAVWWSQENDVALLLVLDVGMREQSPRLDAIEWSSADGPCECSAVGFPAADMTQFPDGSVMRDSREIGGVIRPLTAYKHGVWSIEVNRRAGQTNLPGSAWSGLSGAAVFADNLLIGVITTDPDPGDATRRELRAIPAALFARDTLFQRWIDVDGAVLRESSNRPGKGGQRIPISHQSTGLLEAPIRPLPEGLDLARSPFTLLLPEYAVVPFVEFGGHLTDLLGWCRSSDRFNIKTIVGPGGSGKTRLAGKAATILANEGWQAGFLADQLSEEAAPRLARDTVFILDNAEGRSTVLLDLIKLYGGSSLARVRILLISRQRGAWWTAIKEELPDLVIGFDGGEIALTPDDVSADLRQILFNEARSAYRALLQERAGESDEALLADQDATPLMLQLSALLRITGKSEVTAPGEPADLLKQAIGRERVRWRQHPLWDKLDVDMYAATSLVATVILTEPTREDLGILIEAIPELDLGSVARRRALEWLADLYPNPRTHGEIASLKPDLLAQQLLEETAGLKKITVAVQQAVSTLAPEQAAAATVRMLDILLKSSTEGNALAGTALDGLLNSSLKRIIDIAKATERRDLPPLLSASLERHHAFQAAFVTVLDIPYERPGFADLAYMVALQAHAFAQALPGTEYDVARVGVLSILVKSLVTLGKDDSARAFLPQLLEGMTKQFQHDPDYWASDLAAVMDMAWPLMLATMRDLAEDAAEGAVRIRRTLLERGNTDDSTVLGAAKALSNLGIVKTALGKPDEALAASKAAAAILERLAGQTSSTEVLETTAATYLNLANRLSEAGQNTEAVDYGQQAESLLRSLADSDPEQYAPRLATCLANLAVFKRNLSLLDEALPIARESVEIRSRLAASFPSVYLGDLTKSLYTLAKLESVAGNAEKAAELALDALAKRRELAEAGQAEARSELSIGLYDTAQLCARQGRLADATRLGWEAVKISSELAGLDLKTYGDRFQKALYLMVWIGRQVGEEDRYRSEVESFLTKWEKGG
jgi:tetratricopeptide (TPR) repeat protein